MRRNVVYHGRFQQMLLGDIPPESFDLVLADPPFNISRKSSYSNPEIGYNPDKGEWDNIEDREYWCMMRSYVHHCWDVMKLGANILTFGCYGSLIPVWYPFEVYGMNFRDHIVWHKSNPAPSVHRRGLTFSHELILWFSKPGAKWTFNYEESKKWNPTGKQQHNVIDCAAVRKKAGVTRKPPKLISYLIQVFSNPGDLVLDPFMGSGTTAECCKELGRDFIGYEIGEEQCAYMRSQGLTVVDAH